MSEPSTQVHDVVVVGGGNAGISLAAHLRRMDKALSVAIVAPEREHVYRPLLSYVGGGMASPSRTRRRQASLIPRGCRWYQDSVVEVTPAPSADGRHTVRTVGGLTLAASDLVLCPGTAIDWDAVPGSWEACRSRHGSTNYDPHLAPRTWSILSAMTSGEALFLVSNRNTPCPGVGLKPLFLAADHWRRAGCLDAIHMTVVLEDDEPFGLDRADALVRDRLDLLGVDLRTGCRIESVDAAARQVGIRDRAGRQQVLCYDALHLTPPHRGHDWLVASGVADPQTTLVPVDPETLEHPDHPGLWSLGDAARLDTPSSGGGLRKQVPVVSHNIRARRHGGEYLRYDGYTVAPIPLDRRSLLLGERDRHGREVRTVPAFSLARRSAALLAFDLGLQPPVYWHRLLRGRGVQAD